MRIMASVEIIVGLLVAVRLGIVRGIIETNMMVMEGIFKGSVVGMSITDCYAVQKTCAHCYWLSGDRVCI